MSALLGSNESPLPDCRLSICILMQSREGRWVLWPLLIKALLPFRGFRFHDLSPKDPASKTWTLGIRFPNADFGGLQTFNPQHVAPWNGVTADVATIYQANAVCWALCCLSHTSSHLGLPPPNLCELSSIIIWVLLLKSKTEGHRGCHFPFKPKSSASDPFAFNDWTVLSFSNHCYTIFQ